MSGRNSPRDYAWVKIQRRARRRGHYDPLTEQALQLWRRSIVSLRRHGPYAVGRGDVTPLGRLPAFARSRITSRVTPLAKAELV